MHLIPEIKTYKSLGSKVVLEQLEREKELLNKKQYLFHILSITEALDKLIEEKFFPDNSILHIESVMNSDYTDILLYDFSGSIQKRIGNQYTEYGKVVSALFSDLKLYYKLEHFKNSMKYHFSLNEPIGTQLQAILLTTQMVSSLNYSLLEIFLDKKDYPSHHIKI